MAVTDTMTNQQWKESGILEYVSTQHKIIHIMLYGYIGQVVRWDN